MYISHCRCRDDDDDDDPLATGSKASMINTGGERGVEKERKKLAAADSLSPVCLSKRVRERERERGSNSSVQGQPAARV